jgi:hypothetical protein
MFFRGANIMNLPGFTAEASLSKTTGRYRSASLDAIPGNEYLVNHIVPQMMRWKVVTTVLDDGTICVGIEDEDAGISVSLGCY